MTKRWETLPGKRPAHSAAPMWVAALCVALLAFSGIAVAQSATQLPAAHLISPEELLKILQLHQPQPLIFSVGPYQLYQQAHLPHAEYVGAGSEASGRAMMRKRVQPLARNAFIVLYCGCCPWTHCPNVNPAYAELARMGFTNVKVLKIDNDLGTDWVYKGYPTIRGGR